MKTAAVIPTYNNAETIGSVIKGAGRHVDKVIVVDDGSTDDTSSILRRLAKHGHCTVLTHQENRGKGEALRSAINHLKSRRDAAGLEAVVFLDADGEHNPKEIPQFLNALETADVVLGRRTSYRSRARHLLNSWMALWFRLLDPVVADPSCGFRAIRWNLLQGMELGSSGFCIDAEIILEAIKAGASVNSISVSHTRYHSSSLKTVDFLRINNFFDRWVLDNAKSLNINPVKKSIVTIGAMMGLFITGITRRERAGRTSRDVR